MHFTVVFFFSSRRRHTRSYGDWSSDVCSSDLGGYLNIRGHPAQIPSASGRNELWLPTQYHNMTTDAPSPDSAVQSVLRHLNLATRTLLTANTDKVIMSALYVHNPTANGAYLAPGWNAGVAGPIDLAFSVDGQMVYV